MEINKETVEKRLTMLNNKKAQLLQTIESAAANVNAYNGAIEDCNHWLAVLGKEEAEAAPEAPRLSKVD